jgi:cytochrome P450
MTDTAPASTRFPTERRCPFDPPEELGRIRERSPVSPLSYPDGHEGWLVTGHAETRAVLADRRFSNRAELRHLPIRHGLQEAGPTVAPPGMFLRMDPPEHTRIRRLLTGQFTVRRMNELEPRIAAIVAEHLDAMAEQAPPVDLVAAFALPVPSLVICELLGVPYSDRDEFQGYAATLLSTETSGDEVRTAIGALWGYLGGLVAAKRSAPGHDLLDGLIATGELTDDELIGVGALLLIAGHETTANMLGLGTFALLSTPDQMAALRADPALIPGAVEELLRHLSVAHFTTRTALEDVELGGRTVRAGQCVTLSLAAANRDPRRFTDAEQLDVAGPAGSTGHAAYGHLAFGHGIHQCLGQQLSRIEMRVGFAGLLERFPGLRLAVPAEEVPLRTAIYGVHRLPVSW